MIVKLCHWIYGKAYHRLLSCRQIFVNFPMCSFLKLLYLRIPTMEITWQFSYSSFPFIFSFLPLKTKTKNQKTYFHLSLILVWYNSQSRINFHSTQQKGNSKYLSWTFYIKIARSQVRAFLSHYIFPKDTTVLHDVHKNSEVVWQMVTNLEVHNI